MRTSIIGTRSCYLLSAFSCREALENSCVTENGGRATDRHSSDRPFNRPTDQRNPIENGHGIRPKKCCNRTIRPLASVKSFQWCHRTESKIRSDDTIDFFLKIFLNFYSWNLSALSPDQPTLAADLGPLVCSSCKAPPPCLYLAAALGPHV